MARRAKKAEQVEIMVPPCHVEPEGVVVKGMAVIKPGFDIVPIRDARLLVTVHGVGLNDAHAAELSGAYVRIKPPPGSADDDVERMRTALLEAGAAVVRVVPAPRAAVMTKEARATPPPRETLRQAVLALVETVSSQDREVLRAKVEQVLGKVGV